MSKKVIVSGVTGMDGSLMVDYLLKNTDSLVYGMVRRTSNPNLKNLEKAISNPRFQLVSGDLTDSQSMNQLIKEIHPDYFINFAAQSFVGLSWKMPEMTFDVDANGVLRLLEAVRVYAPKCRVYNAGSSEEFGDTIVAPQNETHPLRPQSPYGAAKAAARHLIRVYRESYNLYAIQGILFNHEGPRRGEEFVTRKITKNVARIKKAIDSGDFNFPPLELGNLDAKRDWGDAQDFVEGVWMMLNQREYLNKAISKKYNGRAGLIFSSDFKPKEYVLSSNETHTVREFVELAFASAGIRGVWWNIDGQPTSEEYLLSNDGKLATKNKVTLLRINPKFYRPAEVNLLHGDSSLVRSELGWSPKTSFEQLVGKMVRNDILNYGK